MINKAQSSESRIKRHERVRKTISGTPSVPRLCVFRSAKHIYAQVIDDVNRVTIASASTLDKDFDLENGGNKDAAKKVGELIAKHAMAKGVENVVFDRGGFLYHGRIKELAEGAREGGLKF